MKTKIALYCGSFNPIHNGHMMVANYVLEHTDVEEVWFVPTMQNPQKNSKETLPFDVRCHMISKVIHQYDDLKMSVQEMERNLEPPYYTINTIIRLEQLFGEKYEFSLIMGYDSFISLHTWKDYKEIVKRHIIICPRLANGIQTFDQQVGHIKDFIYHYSITCEVPKTNFTFLQDMPLSTMSSSFIRNEMKEGRDIRFYVPHEVWRYLEMIKREQEND